MAFQTIAANKSKMLSMALSAWQGWQLPALAAQTDLTNGLHNCVADIIMLHCESLHCIGTDETCVFVGLFVLLSVGLQRTYLA